LQSQRIVLHEAGQPFQWFSLERCDSDTVSGQALSGIHLVQRRNSEVRLMLCLIVLATLSGCGVVAFPFRVTGDAVQAVPVVGKPIGKPIHAVGDAIDWLTHGQLGGAEHDIVHQLSCRIDVSALTAVLDC
jgi:hypothetical protein